MFNVVKHAVSKLDIFSTIIFVCTVCYIREKLNSGPLLSQLSHLAADILDASR